MIYLKLAYRNMRRSLRDYAIYFFTIVLSVMIFYSFNSLKDQPVIVDVCREAGMDTSLIAVLLGAISFFVAFIVAALVLYSNSFIIRRRKREWGTYLLLGMSQGAVARLLFVETLAVGLMACALGVVAGVFFSGLLNMVFAMILQVSLPMRLLSFSLYSALLTSILYGLIFVGVGVMSSFAVSRHSLATLLTATRTNEGYKARNRWVTAIFGFASWVILGSGYWIGFQAIASPSFDPASPVYLLVAGLMIVGSFGFFYAGIGFIFDLFRHLDRFRWKGLTTFTMQQIMKKINSNTLVLTATNILLAMIITSVVFLVAFQSIFDQEKAGDLPYAYAVLYLDPGNLDGFDGAANANPQNPVLKKLSITRYVTEIASSDLILPDDAKQNETAILSNDGACSLVGLSEYNAVRQAKGLSPVRPENGAIVVQTGSQDALLSEQIQTAVNQGLSVHLAEASYPVTQVVTEPFVSAVTAGPCMLIALDTVAMRMPVDGAQTTLMYDYANGDDAIVEESLLNEIYRVGGGYWTSKQEEAASLKMVQVFIMFPGLFVEIILLLTCASGLGLQQLIETVESSHHYQNLHHLGADDGQINRSIFHQVTFYFFVPVVLAILHSLVALTAFKKLASGMIWVNPVGLWLVLGGLLLVYGLYYFITWRNCARITLAQGDVAAVSG